jgi:hypothetical protein
VDGGTRTHDERTGYYMISNQASWPLEDVHIHISQRMRSTGFEPVQGLATVDFKSTPFAALVTSHKARIGVKNQEETVILYLYEQGETFQPGFSYR